MSSLTPDRLSLLREIAAARAPYMVEDPRNWGEDHAEVTALAGYAEDLLAAGLIQAVGNHFLDDAPGIFTLYVATDAGRARAAEG